MMTHMVPTHWQSPPDTAAPGTRQTWLPQEPLRGLALHPAAEELEREVAKPPLACCLGKAAGSCQCNCGGSKTVSGLGGGREEGGNFTRVWMARAQSQECRVEKEQERKCFQE